MMAILAMWSNSTSAPGERWRDRSLDYLAQRMRRAQHLGAPKLSVDNPSHFGADSPPHFGADVAAEGLSRSRPPITPWHPGTGAGPPRMTPSRIWPLYGLSKGLETLPGGHNQTAAGLDRLAFPRREGGRETTHTHIAHHGLPLRLPDLRLRLPARETIPASRTSVQIH